MVIVLLGAGLLAAAVMLPDVRTSIQEDQAERIAEAEAVPVVAAPEPIDAFRTPSGLVLANNDQLCERFPKEVAEVALDAEGVLQRNGDGSGLGDWSGRCNWSNGGSYLVEVRVGPVRAELQTTFEDETELSVAVPDECSEVETISVDPNCIRIVRIPDLGDAAMMSQNFSRLSPESDRAWRVGVLRFRQAAAQVDVRVELPSEATVETAVEVARIVSANLPTEGSLFTIIPTPPECQNSPEEC